VRAAANNDVDDGLWLWVLGCGAVKAWVSLIRPASRA